MFILDSDTLDALMIGHVRQHVLIAHINEHNADDVVTTIINVQEKFEGWLSKLKQRNISDEKLALYYSYLSRLVISFAEMEVLPFDISAVKKFNELVAMHLGAVGSDDLKIAAIALCNNSSVITRNTAHFRKVPNLRVEDWLADEPEV